MDDVVPPSTDAPAPSANGPYKDDDLVYVDPESRTVVGRVEWSNTGRPKSLERPSKVVEEDDDDGKEKASANPKDKGKRGGRPMRKPRVRYYPWGTYRSMKKLFKIEGKVPEVRGNATLDDVLPKALNEAFWD